MKLKRKYISIILIIFVSLLAFNSFGLAETDDVTIKQTLADEIYPNDSDGQNYKVKVTNDSGEEMDNLSLDWTLPANFSLSSDDINDIVINDSDGNKIGSINNNNYTFANNSISFSEEKINNLPLNDGSSIVVDYNLPADKDLTQDGTDKNLEIDFNYDKGKNEGLMVTDSQNLNDKILEGELDFSLSLDPQLQYRGGEFTVTAEIENVGEGTLFDSTLNPEQSGGFSSPSFDDGANTIDKLEAGSTYTFEYTYTVVDNKNFDTLELTASNPAKGVSEISESANFRFEPRRPFVEITPPEDKATIDFDTSDQININVANTSDGEGPARGLKIKSNIPSDYEVTELSDGWSYTNGSFTYDNGDFPSDGNEDISFKLESTDPLNQSDEGIITLQAEYEDDEDNKYNRPFENFDYDVINIPTIDIESKAILGDNVEHGDTDRLYLGDKISYTYEVSLTELEKYDKNEDIKVEITKDDKRLIKDNIDVSEIAGSFDSDDMIWTLKPSDLENGSQSITLDFKTTDKLNLAKEKVRTKAKVTGTLDTNDEDSNPVKIDDNTANYFYLQSTHQDVKIEKQTKEIENLPDEGSFDYTQTDNKHRVIYKVSYNFADDSAGRWKNGTIIDHLDKNQIYNDDLSKDNGGGFIEYSTSPNSGWTEVSDENISSTEGELKFDLGFLEKSKHLGLKKVKGQTIYFRYRLEVTENGGIDSWTTLDLENTEEVSTKFHQAVRVPVSGAKAGVDIKIQKDGSEADDIDRGEKVDLKIDLKKNPWMIKDMKVRVDISGFTYGDSSNIENYISTDFDITVNPNISYDSNNDEIVLDFSGSEFRDEGRVDDNTKMKNFGTITLKNILKDCEGDYIAGATIEYENGLDESKSASDESKEPTIKRKSDLIISAVNPIIVKNNTVSWTLDVTNTDIGTARNVEFIGNFGDVFKYKSYQLDNGEVVLDEKNQGANQRTWNLGEIPSGETKSITITANITDADEREIKDYEKAFSSEVKWYTEEINEEKYECGTEGGDDNYFPKFIEPVKPDDLRVENNLILAEGEKGLNICSTGTLEIIIENTGKTTNYDLKVFQDFLETGIKLDKSKDIQINYNNGTDTSIINTDNIDIDNPIGNLTFDLDTIDELSSDKPSSIGPGEEITISFGIKTNSTFNDKNKVQPTVKWNPPSKYKQTDPERDSSNEGRKYAIPRIRPKINLDLKGRNETIGEKKFVDDPAGMAGNDDVLWKIKIENAGDGEAKNLRITSDFLKENELYKNYNNGNLSGKIDYSTDDGYWKIDNINGKNDDNTATYYLKEKVPAGSADEETVKADASWGCDNDKRLTEPGKSNDESKLKTKPIISFEHSSKNLTRKEGTITIKMTNDGAPIYNLDFGYNLSDRYKLPGDSNIRYKIKGESIGDDSFNWKKSSIKNEPSSKTSLKDLNWEINNGTNDNPIAAGTYEITFDVIHNGEELANDPDPITNNKITANYYDLNKNEEFELDNITPKYVNLSIEMTPEKQVVSDLDNDVVWTIKVTNDESTDYNDSAENTKAINTTVKQTLGDGFNDAITYELVKDHGENSENNFSFNNSTLTGTNLKIPAGKFIKIKITTKMNANGSHTNTVQAREISNQDDKEFIESETQEIEAYTAAFKLTKKLLKGDDTDHPKSGYFTPGEIVEYKVTAELLGNVEYNNLKIIDELPDGLKYDETNDNNIPDDWVYKKNGKKLKWNPKNSTTESGNSTKTFKYKLRVVKDGDISRKKPVKNTAKASFELEFDGDSDFFFDSGDEDIENKGALEDTATFIFEEPKLTIERTKNEDIIQPKNLALGPVDSTNKVRHTITVTNGSSDDEHSAAYETKIVESIPEEFKENNPIKETDKISLKIGDNGLDEGEENDYTVNYNKSDGKLTFKLNENTKIDPGKDLVIEYTAFTNEDIKAGENQTFTAKITEYYSQLKETNDREKYPDDDPKATVEFTTEDSDLEVSATPKKVTPGDKVDYTVKFEVPANTTINDFALEAELPQGIEFISASGPGLGDGSGTWEPADSGDAEKDNGQTLRFNENITVQHDVNKTYTLTFEGRVLDIEEVKRGNDNNFETTVKYGYNGNGYNANDFNNKGFNNKYDNNYSDLVQSVDFTIVEPALEGELSRKNLNTDRGEDEKPQAGDTLEYILKITSKNDGNRTTAYDVELESKLSEVLDYIDGSAKIVGSANGNSIDSEVSLDNNNTLKWPPYKDTKIDIETDETVTVSFKVKVTKAVKPNQELNNEMTIKWSTQDGDKDEQRDSNSVPESFENKYKTTVNNNVNSEDKINIVINSDSNRSEIGDDKYRIGDIVEYTITVGDIMKGTIPGVEVKAILPDGLEFYNTDKTDINIDSDITIDENYKNPADGTTGSHTWDFGKIVNKPNKDNNTIEITFLTLVTKYIEDIEELTTKTNLSYKTYNGDKNPELKPIDPEPKDDDTVTSVIPDLTMEKTTDFEGKLSAEDEVEFTLTVENNGSAPAYDIEIQDIIPEGMRDGRVKNIKINDKKIDEELKPTIDEKGEITWDLDDNNNDDDKDGKYTLDPKKELVIEYTINTDEDLKAGQNLTSEAKVTNYYSFDDDNIPEDSNKGNRKKFELTEFNDAKLSSVEPKAVTLSGPETVPVGEEITYTLKIPEDAIKAEMNDLKVDHEFNLQGMEFIDAELNNDKTVNNDETDEINITDVKINNKENGLSTMDFKLDKIGVDEQAVIKITARASKDSGIGEGNETELSAEVTWKEDSDALKDNHKLTITEPELEATQTITDDSPESPVAGEEVTFNLNINETNDKNASAAQDVKITATLAAGLEYVEDSLKIVGSDIKIKETSVDDGQRQKITWSLDSAITTGENLDLKYTVKLKDSVKPSQELTNEIKVDWKSVADENNDSYGRKYNLDLDTDVPSNAPINTPDTSSIKKTVEDTTFKSKDVRIGDIVTYKLKIDLQKGTSTNFKVEDTLPDGMNYVDTVKKIDEDIEENSKLIRATKFKNNRDIIVDDSTKITWDISTITNNADDNQTFEIIYRAQVTDADAFKDHKSPTLENTATIDYDGIDESRDDTEDTAEINLKQPKLEITEFKIDNNNDSDEDKQVAPGDTVSYTIKAQNNGSAPVYDTNLEGLIPKGLRDTGIIEASIKIDSDEKTSITPEIDDDGKIKWKLLSSDSGKNNEDYTIPVGGNLTLSYKLKVDEKLPIKNIVKATIEADYYSFGKHDIPKANQPGEIFEAKSDDRRQYTTEEKETSIIQIKDAELNKDSLEHFKNTTGDAPTVILTPNGRTLKEIKPKEDGDKLKENVDYEVEELENGKREITFTKDYLDKQDIGDIDLDFVMDYGKNPDLTIKINEYQSSVNPEEKADQRELSAGPYDEQDDNKKGKIIFTFKDQAGNKVTGEKVELSIPEEYKEDLNYDDFKYSLDEGDDKDWSDKIEDLNNELKTDNSGQVIVYVKNKKADENLRISAKMIIMNTEKVISGELTIVSAAANKLGFVKKPEDNFAGNEMAPVEVEVLDEYGNRITDYTGKIDIAIGNNAGPDGNLNGTTKSVTVKDGIAKFDDLSIDKSGRDYTFEATSGNLDKTESEKFNIKENISISAEDKNKITSNPQPSISGTVDDLESGNDAKITIKDDKGNVVFEGETTVGEDGDWEIKSKDVPELTDGDYTVEAKITDENDNESTDQGTLRIITTEPELSTELKGEHDIRRPEDKTSYTLDIKNIGETEVKDLTITTPIPAGFELNQDTIKVDAKEIKKEEFELRDGNLIIEKDELAKDDTVTIKFAGQISSSGSEVAAGSIISTKSKIVYNDPLDNIYQLDSNMVKLKIKTANGIKIKPVRFKAGQPDSQLVFAHTIVNMGNSLEKVVVNLDGLDRYDISWYYDQNSDGKLDDGDQLITDSKRKDIKINSLSAGGQQDILLVVDIPADAVKTEKTFAIKINSTLNNLDDQVEDKLTVIDNAPKLNLYDKDNKDLVYAGGRYQLEVEYGNQGEDILSDSTLEIPLPDEIDGSNSDLTNNTDNSSYDKKSNTITVEVADLDPSEERSFTLDLKVKDGIEQGTEIKTEVNFKQNGSPILKEDHSITVAEKIASKIELEAEPEIIKGDKKEISILTASLKDLLDSPVDGEVDLEFEVNTKKLEQDYEIILEEDNDYETEIKSDDLTAKITTKSGEAKIKLKAEIKSDDIVEIPVDVTAKNEDAGLAKQRVYIVLSKGMLVGRIIDSSSNLPEVGLKVELKSDEEETKTTSTDKNGRYSFKVDENKNYEISIAEKEDGAGGFDIEVKIGKDEITNSPRAIEGKIYYEETKEPKEGAVIELYKPDGTFYGETTSVKNGRYNFEIDKTPNKKVKRRKNSSNKWTLKAPGSNLKKGVVNPKVGVTLLNANLSILGASNYGQVVNKNDNSPIEKADVTLKDSSNNQVLLPEINNAAQDNPYKSESDGKYIFKDVNPASYYVTASKDGFYDYQSKLIDIATKNDIKDLNYRIEMEAISKDDLDIKKETEAEYTRPGEEVEYTITVQNNKDTTISELTVDDILPSELVYVKDSANLAGSHSNGEINWKLNDLKPGKTELKYKVKVTEDAEMGIKAVNEVEAELNGVIFKEKHELQISPPDLIINKTASEDRISIGDFISYKVEIQNDTGFDVDEFTLYDKIPAGFKYVEDSAVIIGENGAEDKLKTDANRLLSYSDLNLASGDSLEIRYTLVVGTGVVTSNSYVNKAYAKFEKELISNIAKESVLVVKDPLFNTSTIIGKVYVDRNDDGMQTEGEKGLGGIDIISTSGQVVTTDEYGRFHFTIESDSNIQQAQTVVLKLKSDTLPDGATIRSNNPVIAKITSGVSLEVNFRIKTED